MGESQGIGGGQKGRDNTSQDPGQGLVYCVELSWTGLLPVSYKSCEIVWGADGNGNREGQRGTRRGGEEGGTVGRIDEQKREDFNLVFNDGFINI